MINQTISHITQTGASNLAADASVLGFTQGQMYFLIAGGIALVFLTIFFIYNLFKTYLEKSCAGCKRLNALALRVSHLEDLVEDSEESDTNILREIRDSVAQLRKEIEGNGKY